MGLFDSLQNLISGVTDAVQGSATDALNGLGDVPVLQDIQDTVGSTTESLSTTSEQMQTTADDTIQKIGL